MAGPKTIPIGYCGKKEQETDHLYGTGLVWEPDTIHDVPVDKAALLLNHPDVWFDTRSDKAKDKNPVEPVEPQNKRTVDEEITTASIDLPQNFEELTFQELDAFSVRNFNVSLEEATPMETLRDEVRQLVDRTKFDSMGTRNE